MRSCPTRGASKPPKRTPTRILCTSSRRANVRTRTRATSSGRRSVTAASLRSGTGTRGCGSTPAASTRRVAQNSRRPLTRCFGTMRSLKSVTHTSAMSEPGMALVTRRKRAPRHSEPRARVGGTVQVQSLAYARLDTAGVARTEDGRVLVRPMGHLRVAS